MERLHEDMPAWGSTNNLVIIEFNNLVDNSNTEFVLHNIIAIRD